MSKRKIVFIINPISGTEKKEILKNIITNKVQSAGISYSIMPSDKSGNYSSLKKEINTNNITDVVICGGDGTINAVCTSLFNQNVNIGIIPSGSGNGLARTAGIPLNKSKALDIILAGKTSQIDGFLINEQFSWMLSGIGFDAQVAHAFAKSPKRGLYTYIKKSIYSFFTAKASQFEIQLPDATFNTKAFFISIANANQFGNNFTIAPKASLSDGLLDIIIVPEMNKVILPFTVLNHIAGNNKLSKKADNLSRKNIIYFQTPQLKIRNINLAPLHIDGDPKETSSFFDIKILPKAIKLLMP